MPKAGRAGPSVTRPRVDSLTGDPLLKPGNGGEAVTVLIGMSLSTGYPRLLENLFLNILSDTRSGNMLT